MLTHNLNGCLLTLPVELSLSPVQNLLLNGWKPMAFNNGKTLIKGYI
jgi:hypothetical protein